MRPLIAAALLALSVTPGLERFRLSLLEINFFGGVPELESSIRISQEASADSPPSVGAVPPVGGDGPPVSGLTRSVLRVQVLVTLPRGHERYLYEEMRKLCRVHLHDNRVAASEISPEQLFSEIWLRLFGAAVLPKEEAKFASPTPEGWNADPKHDTRVIWLIREIGGPKGFTHRCEDIRREQWGRVVRGGGRRTVQPDDGDEAPEKRERAFEGGKERPVDQSIQETDARRAWRGLIVALSREFEQEEDASKLLRLLEQLPDVFEGPSEGRWPVATIVRLLNNRFPPPTWTDHRVEDAKKRLVNWVKRFKRRNGFDTIDLEAFFARLAPQQVGAESAKLSLDLIKCSQDE